MSDIPRNTEYQTGGVSSATPPKVTTPRVATPAAPKATAADLLNLHPKLPSAQAPTYNAPNVMGAFTPVSQDVKDYLSQTSATGFLPETPIGAPAEQKISPIPEGYSPFVVPGEHTNPASGVVPEKPMIQQFPTGGQMNIDVAHPGQLNKSVRASLTPLSSENASMLGTLSNKMFQVDHIIPLWAGGADTIANKQILPNPVHDAKTRIQAVAQTLLDNGEIDLNQARVMAITWQNRSAKGIPDTNDYGEIPLATAKQLAKEWAQFDAGKGPGPGLGEILRGIPEAAGNLGKGVIPEAARQFLVGIVSGATAGGVPLESAEGATLADKASGLVGEAIGMYVGVGKFAKLTDMAGRAAGLIKPGIKLAAGSTEGGASILDAITPVAKAATGATAAEKVSLSMAQKMKAAPKTIMNDIRGKLATDIVGRAARNAAAFGAYGQAGQTLSDFTQPHQDVLKGHVDRLWQDLAFGAVTGAAPGTWKGAGFVGGSVATLGLMAGENLQNALGQGLAMTALHKVGGFGQDIAKQQREIEQMSQDAAGKGALTIMHTIVGDKPGLTAVDPAKPMPKYDSTKLDEWKDEGVAKLDQMLADKSISPTIWMRLKTSLLAAHGALKTRELPYAQQDRAYWEQMSSMAKFAKERNNISDLSVPNSLEPYAKKFSEMFPDRIKESPDQVFERERWQIADNRVGEKSPQNAGATGEIPFTGENASPENLADHKIFVQKLRSGEVAPYGIIANSNDPLFGVMARDSNRAITQKDIEAGVNPIDPANHLRVFAITVDKTTGKPNGIIRTGMSVPTKERIGEITTDETGKQVVKGNKFSFNSHPLISGPEAKYPANDHNFNNKTITAALMNRGLSAVPVRFKAFLTERDASNPRHDIPYTVGIIGDEELNMARQIQGALGHPASLNTIEENLVAAQKLKGTGIEGPYIEKAAEQLADQGHNASTIVASDRMSGHTQEQQGALFEVLDKSNKVLSESTTANEVAGGFDTLLGVKLKPEEAHYLEENKSTVTGPEVVQMINGASAEGRTTPMTTAAVETYLRPIESSKEFNGSVSGMLYKKMPVMSKNEVHDARATKLSALSGKQLLEAEPIIKPIPKEASVTPEFQSALDELQTVGSGGEYTKQDLRSYAEQLVRTIKESGLPPEDQARLGVEAQKLINRDDLNQRGVIMGPPEEIGSTLESDITPEISSDKFNQFVTGVKDYIKEQTGAGEPPRTMLPEEERRAINMANIPAMVKADVKPYFDAISEGKTSDPTTYVRGHDQAFDELATKVWGKDYQKNYGLMQLLSDRSALGRKYYEQERVTKRGIKPALMSTETRGEQIGQPKDVLAAVPEGPAAVSAAYARRKESYTGGVSEDLTKLPEQAAEVVGGGESGTKQSGRITDPNQAPEENVQDLTQYESELQKGLLDEEARGAHPVLSPKRGVEDAVSQIFSLVERYNSAVREGAIRGETVNLGNFDATKKKILADIEKEGAAVIKSTEEIKKARETLDSLMKQHESLSNVGGSKAIQYAKKVKETDAPLIERLNKIIGESKPKAEGGGGQGGPGINSMPSLFNPATHFSNLGMSMPVLNPMAQSTTATTSPFTLPGSTPGQSPLRYLTGTSVVDNTKPAPLLNQVQTPTQAPKTLSDVVSKYSQKYPSKIKMGPTTITSSARNVKPQPATDYSIKPNFLQNVKDAISNLMPANTSVYNKPETKGAKNNNPIISGYDTSSYAEDPIHAQRIRSIMSGIPQITSAADAGAYIARANKASPLTGQMIMNTAQKYGVPPELIIATVQQDSSLGTLGLAVKNKNPGNVGTYVDKKGRSLVGKYPTWQDGVDAVGEWLQNHKVSGPGATYTVGQANPKQYVNQVVQR